MGGMYHSFINISCIYILRHIILGEGGMESLRCLMYLQVESVGGMYHSCIIISCIYILSHVIYITHSHTDTYTQEVKLCRAEQLARSILNTIHAFLSHVSTS
jgi:hypothetical protein